MIKLIFFFALFGFSLTAEEFKWESIPLGGNSSQCIFRPESKIFGCRRMTTIVECSATSELAVIGSTKFDIYGLAKESIVGEIDPKTIKYILYPKKLDNNTYLNSSTFNLWLYQSEKFIENGFRVNEAKCWERLVELFADSPTDHIVNLENGSEINLFGEILFAEKPVQKRWIGWGLGWGAGWGWGFPGWGLPLWGLAWGK